MDYSQLIGTVIQLVIEIANNHIQRNPSELLTDEIVRAELDKRLSDEQSVIAAEFLRHNIKLPD